MPNTSYPKRCAGFTLVELTLTLAVAATTLHFGVPSMQQSLTTNRLAAQTNLLISSLYNTRSEAIKRNTRVTLRKTGTNWEDGWMIFTDGNDNALFDADQGEELLHQQTAISGASTLRGNRFVKDYISYTGDGGSRTKSGAFQAGTLMLCDRHQSRDPRHARAIIIGSSGRPRASSKQRDLKDCISVRG